MATLPENLVTASDLLTGMEFSSARVRELFKLAADVKARPEHYRTALAGRFLALIFEKPSLRTRVTFDVGIQSLGGGAVFLDHTGTRLGQRESIKDVAKIAEVSILALDRNWSGSGHVKTLDRPLRVREVLLADGTPALASDGAPSDCVALAVLGLLPEPVDLVVSGINGGPNLGHDLT